MKKWGINARANLKVLETLTYNFTEVHYLEELANKIECLIKEYQCHLPKSDCFLLRSTAQHRAKQWRVKQIKQKYLALPLLLRRGRKRNDWRFRGRVGQKADTLRNDTLRKVNVKILSVFACLV